MSKINVGQFVRTSNNALGVGKVVECNGSTVVVEYFDSVGADARVRVDLDASGVERTQLSLQRRCYWQDGETWRVGRVVWQDASRYAVRIPDTDVDIPVDEASLYVRWDRPIDDPTDVLAAYGNESPHFHACRQPFVESTMSQRAASRGMHGLLSAVVEVHNHQVEVVRRVLEDPVQRYLLADEVGLGKTIEAGLVIRQLLLDKPTAHVVVIAPPLLRRQWVAELREKFLIDDFDEATISVLSHDKPDSWLTDATDPQGRTVSRLDADLVVVDEVHNLAALHDRPDPLGGYSSLRTLATAVPRLLLLSATPLLNNERTFLAMLHLLDPEVYDLDDAAGFERRVASRRDLANAFFTMRPDTPAFLLKEKLETLAGLFPDDARLAGLLSGVEQAAGADELAEAVTAVRAHISETYRLHRRLLRTRRSDALLSTFPVRGRSRPSPIEVEGGAVSAALDWLDAWRVLVRSAFVDASTDTSMAVRAFIAMAERSASSTTLLKAAAQYRLKPSDELLTKAELSSDEAEALRSSVPTADERALLKSADDLEEDSDTLDALAKALRSANPRTVVFTSFTTTAEAVAAHLRGAFGSDAVATHLSTDDPSEVEAALDQFREDGGACRVLVCDRSAEEGRNLQFADAAVYFDLTFSPNRFEQRIGRLDRYGQGSPIMSMCPRYPTDSVADAWLTCLTDGFGMFDDSLASLQFAIDALLPRLHEALFDDGATGLRGASADLPDRLGAERLAVAEQDALDAVEEATYDRPLAEALDDVEDLWFQHQVAAEDLLSQRHGNLRFHRVVDRSDERFRSYKLTRPGKGASLNSMPLVAWDLLLSRFRPVVDRVGTFSRRSAIARRGARLFRVGEPLIDALSDYIRWDDRGQTFALWRVWPGAGDDAAYFRFDYVVDADVVGALGDEDPTVAATALKRRADKFLPPQAHTIWTDLDGGSLSDGAVVAVLERGYDPDGTDFNLNADRRWALELLVGSEWPSKCHDARRESELSLRSSDAFTDAVAKATRDFDLARRQDRLQREVRLRHLEGAQRSVDAADFARTEHLEETLSTALAEPTVRLDSIGCVVLSRGVPDGPGFRRR